MAERQSAVMPFRVMVCPGEKSKNSLARREMLKLSAAAVAAGTLGLGAKPFDQEAAVVPVSGPGRVVKVHMPGMRSGMFPDPAASRVMVDRAVAALAGEKDTGRAWRRIVTPSDRVVIKVNCLGTRMLSSMREVVYAVVNAVREAGVPDAQIMILDLYASNMMGGRFAQQRNPEKMRVIAHKDGGYSQGWIQAGPARAKFSDYLLWSTAVINVPPIKDHDLAGVTCTLKNMSFGTVEKPYVNHRVINEAVAHLYAREEIRSRVRINIVDGSRVLYDGGPKFRGSSHVLHECIYASTDPVAVDAVATALVEGIRREKGLRPLAAVGRPPNFLKIAEDLGLGTANTDRIRLEAIELPPFESGNTDLRKAEQGAEAE